MSYQCVPSTSLQRRVTALTKDVDVKMSRIKLNLFITGGMLESNTSCFDFELAVSLKRLQRPLLQPDMLHEASRWRSVSVSPFSIFRLTLINLIPREKDEIHIMETKYL